MGRQTYVDIDQKKTYVDIIPLNKCLAWSSKSNQIWKGGNEKEVEWQSRGYFAGRSEEGTKVAYNRRQYIWVCSWQLEKEAKPILTLGGWVFLNVIYMAQNDKRWMDDIWIIKLIFCFGLYWGWGPKNV